MKKLLFTTFLCVLPVLIFSQYKRVILEKERSQWMDLVSDYFQLEDGGFLLCLSEMDGLSKKKHFVKYNSELIIDWKKAVKLKGIESFSKIMYSDDASFFFIENKKRKIYLNKYNWSNGNAIDSAIIDLEKISKSGFSERQFFIDEEYVYLAELHYYDKTTNTKLSSRGSHVSLNMNQCKLVWTRINKHTYSSETKVVENISPYNSPEWQALYHEVPKENFWQLLGVNDGKLYVQKRIVQNSENEQINPHHLVEAIEFSGAISQKLKLPMPLEESASKIILNDGSICYSGVELTDGEQVLKSSFFRKYDLNGNLLKQEEIKMPSQMSRLQDVSDLAISIVEFENEVIVLNSGFDDYVWTTFPKDTITADHFMGRLVEQTPIHSIIENSYVSNFKVKDFANSEGLKFLAERRKECNRCRFIYLPSESSEIIIETNMTNLKIKLLQFNI